jgi:hypothetical protein
MDYATPLFISEVNGLKQEHEDMGRHPRSRGRGKPPKPQSQKKKGFPSLGLVRRSLKPSTIQKQGNLENRFPQKKRATCNQTIDKEPEKIVPNIGISQSRVTRYLFTTNLY